MSNTNGLIRQFIPKGTKLEEVSEAALRKIEQRPSNPPRQVLGFRTPKEALQQMTFAQKNGALKNTKYGLFQRAATTLAQRIVTTKTIHAEIAFIKLDNASKNRFLGFLPSRDRGVLI